MNFPSRVSRIRSASRSIDRCLDIAAPLMSKRDAIFPAGRRPDFRSESISRRVGSLIACRVCCSPDFSQLLSIYLTFNLNVKYSIAQARRFVKRKFYIAVVKMRMI